MSSFKTLFGALCALSLTLPLFGQAVGDSRSSRDDSRSSPTGDQTYTIPNEIGGKTYEQWKADLSHADPSVRAAAIEVIPAFREKAMDAVPLLVDRTRDKDASPRVKAVLALKFMGIRGTDRSRVVKALGERIASDTQAIVRYEAARALLRFGADGRDVVGDLVHGVGDGSTWELRHACIMALIVAGVDPKKGPDSRVIDALILRTKVFNEPTAQVRLEAIIALGAMGRPQDPTKLKMVVGAIKEHERSGNIPIRIWAHVSLMALEDKVDKKYLELIAGYLKDRERDIRVQAVTALAALQSKAEDYLPNVLEMLRREKDVQVLSAACNALGHMGNKGTKVLQALIKVTEKDDAESVPAVMAAVNALATIRAPTPEVMEALRALLERKDLNTQAKDAIRKAIEDIQKPRDDDKPKEKAAQK
jgi:HEAT repeat protein